VNLKAVKINNFPGYIVKGLFVNFAVKNDDELFYLWLLLIN
jgi:hypothetical protein